MDISTDEYKEQFDELVESMGNEGYKVIASMTAPLRFTVWSDDPDTVIVPKADVEEIKVTE